MHTRADSLSPYYPFHVTAASATAAPLSRNLVTTSATTIVASTMAVTPVSMVNITTGMHLNISGGTGAAEDVLVASVTATTFTATFANGHSGAYNILSFRPQYLGNLVINAVGSITAISIYNGSDQLYNGGTGTGVLIASIGTPATTVPYLYNCYCTRGVFYKITGTGSVTFMVTDDNVI